jgi:hypothetical protein
MSAKGMVRAEVLRLLQEIGAAGTRREAEDIWWLAAQRIEPFDESEVEAITDAIAELPSEGGVNG